VQFPAQKTVDTAYATIITAPNGQGVASMTLQSAIGIGIGIVQVICNPSNPSFYTDAQLTSLPVATIDNN